MPIQLIYDTDGIDVIIRGSGIVNADELQHSNEQIYSGDRVHKLRSQMFDFTGVSKFDLSTADMDMLAEQDKAAASKSPNLVIAIVGSDDLMFGLAKMWEVFVSEASLKANVFRTITEACAWLDEHAQRRPPKKASQIESTGGHTSRRSSTD